MINELERVINEISSKASDIDELGKEYNINDPRLTELSNLGMHLMSLPEYHQTEWVNGLDQRTTEVLYRYFLLMEIYIPDASCKGIFINCPLQINNDVSRLERVEITKRFINVNLATDDISQLTKDTMNRLIASCDMVETEDSEIYAGLIFNYYYSFIKSATDRMRWTNIRQSVVSNAYENAQNLRRIYGEMLDTINGRAALSSNLNTFHQPIQ